MSKKPLIRVPHKKPLNWNPKPLDLSGVFGKDEKVDKPLETAQALEAARQEANWYKSQLKAIEAARFRALRVCESAPTTERSQTARELLEALIELECNTASLDRFLDSLMQLN